MLGTIVVIICEFAIRALEPLRSDLAIRAYGFFEDLRARTLIKQSDVDPSVADDDDDIWLRLANGQLSSWCKCAEPGKEVLACGHCGCGESVLCWEWVVLSSGVEKRRKASCA